MTLGQRYLIFLGKDESGIVVETQNTSDLENLKQEADFEGNGVPASDH